MLQPGAISGEQLVFLLSSLNWVSDTQGATVAGAYFLQFQLMNLASGEDASSFAVDDTIYTFSNNLAPDIPLLNVELDPQQSPTNNMMGSNVPVGIIDEEAARAMITSPTAAADLNEQLKASLDSQKQHRHHHTHRHSAPTQADKKKKEKDNMEVKNYAGAGLTPGNILHALKDIGVD